MPPEGNIYRRLADALEHDWAAVARPSQLAPAGDWATWLLMAGRGFGKTRSGAEFVRAEIEAGRARRIALIGPTAADVRDVMVEGDSGILAISPSWNRPEYEPSKRRLTWPNGAVALTFSAEEPERLRGPQQDLIWADELAAWRFPECWDLAMMGLRLGKAPRCVVTTTPKPNRLIRSLLADRTVVVTRGRTADNLANLAPAFARQIISKYAGTRLGRQELDAELLSDAPGALWTRDLLDATRVSSAPEMRRIVVAVDPSTTSGESADETGIVVAGVGDNKQGYVLADLSGRYTPVEWATRAVDAYKLHLADRIVAEKNQGGEMIEHTIHTVDPNVPVKLVHASRGKATRAEPVSALFEQHRCHLVGVLAQLEDELANFTTDFDPVRAGFSPGRLDAMVWAFAELMLGQDHSGYCELMAAMAANKGRIPQELLDQAGVSKEAPANLLGVPAQSTNTEPTTVTLHAPRPFALFQIDKTRYAANGDGLVEVAPEHVGAMIGMGCWELRKPE